MAAVAANFEVGGLASSLEKDEKWRKLCKEAELAYSDTVNLSVEQRLIFYFVQSASLLHKSTQMAKVYSPDERDVPQDVLEEFGDLI